MTPEERKRCSCGDDALVAPIGCVGFGRHMRGSLEEWDDWKYDSHRRFNVRAFRLIRAEAIVATGVVLPTGRVVLEWGFPRTSLGIYANFAEFSSIHIDGHDDSTALWVDGTNGEQLGWSDPFSSDKINAALRQSEEAGRDS